MSFLVKAFTGIIEFGNRYFTLGGALFRKDKNNIFVKIETMMIVMILVCFGVLLFIDRFPFWLGVAICILLFQRLAEYLIVYSRNFILNRGRIFSHADKLQRGQWLIIMFFMNLLQVIIIFAIWYRFLSLNIAGAFSKTLSVLDSIYFSVVTFFTIGYGDIVPIAPLAKILAVVQGITAFYTFVIIVNGLISIHQADKK